MPLVLHLIGRDGGNPRRIEVQTRLTVGRGAECDLPLADPDRVMSKNHCVIQYAGSGYTVTDTSTNGVHLNDSTERLERDVPVPLTDGSVLRVGPWELQVIAVTPPGLGAAPAVSGADFFGPSAGGDPFASPFGGAGLAGSDDGLFGDPLAGPPVVPQSAPSHDPFGFGMAAPSGPAGHAAPAADPFGFGTAGPSAPAGGAIPDDIDLFGDNARAATPWPAQAQFDHLPSEHAAFIPPAPKTESIPDDWDFSDLGVPAAAPKPAFQPAPPPAAAPPPVEAVPPAAAYRPATPPPGPAPDPLDDFASPMPPAELRATQPAPAPPPAPLSPRPAPVPGPADAAAIQVFLRAAGLPPGALTPAETERLMQIAGELLAATTRGLMAVLAARASTKQEFRIERTMVGAQRNNPLKVSGSPEEALAVMLAADPPGFLAGRRAVEEALDDIQTHQMAVLAGMQEALITVVERFNPAQLEKRLEQSSLLDSILPGARKARYWELFKSLYKEIAGELEDDFQKAFGAEFARAYSEQIRRP